MEAFRILVVEDKPDDILMLKRALEIVPDQVRIDLARNAREALIYLDGIWAFGEPLPRVIVLDLSTSRPDGLGFLKWMRERQQYGDSMVLVLGDQTNAQEVDCAYDLGATSFISKKSGPLEVVHEVLRLCNDRHPASAADHLKVSAPVSIAPAVAMLPGQRIPPTTTPHGPPV